jgi:hypothetical protein
MGGVPPMSVEHMTPEEIDATFEGMAEDEEYQAEIAHIMQEFAQADWEAFLLAEEHPWPRRGKVHRNA